MGLGIEVIWNHPYRPQENGVVERAHGTTKNWVEPSSCTHLDELQQRLERAAYLQRSCYPYRHGQSRTQYYDGLCRRPIAYPQAPEPWHLEPVDALLAKGHWSRRVDCCGKVSIYGRNYSVGRRYAHQSVFLSFEPSSRSWQVHDEHGDCLKTLPNRELSEQAITTLTLTHTKSRSQSRKQAKLDRAGLT